MPRRSAVARFAVALAAWLMPGSSHGAAPVDVPARETELRAAETAFAATMADRDLDAFAASIAPDAIFLNGDQALRGRDAIVAAWRKYFDGEQAPFAWEPAVVVVLESGDLGLTSGPVTLPDGRRVATFNSVWRREADGRWRIVLDRGCDWCE